MVLHALLLAVFRLAHSLIRVCAYIADPRSAGAPPQAWRTYGLPIYLALLLPLLLAISLPLVGELRRELGGAPAQELPLAAPRWLSTRSQLRSQLKSQLKSRFGQISTALSAAPHRLPWLEDAMRGLWGGLLRQKDTVGDLWGGVMRAGGEGAGLLSRGAKLLSQRLVVPLGGPMPTLALNSTLVLSMAQKRSRAAQRWLREGALVRRFRRSSTLQLYIHYIGFLYKSSTLRFVAEEAEGWMREGRERLSVQSERLREWWREWLREQPTRLGRRLQGGRDVAEHIVSESPNVQSDDPQSDDPTTVGESKRV